MHNKTSIFLNNLLTFITISQANANLITTVLYSHDTISIMFSVIFHLFVQLITYANIQCNFVVECDQNTATHCLENYFITKLVQHVF